ncbi:TIGR03668 family PPOX class F420-dependent oxidoreductase [Actinokineospora enzanensis]|uniref:TIGR03668 family PPOX class F420-dependent oxidoreductase n=1 Tax=Actinokineospora enzanensis TaxID=155975 RepID=UPI000A043A6B|nr:TIGR03668 family PPOX class F420-dependent oxidoreductase [Actinokineospora enzanensis]
MGEQDDGYRQRFAAARVARLGTADAAGIPHLVPVTFAVHEDTIVFAIDHKPKKTTNLKRLRNIVENDRASLLVDEYVDSDWSQLWWVRADGKARIMEDLHEGRQHLSCLVEKYNQYQERPPVGPLVLVAVDRWSGWAYDGR